MPISAKQLSLLDARQRPIGQIMLERCQDDMIFGQFVPGKAFATVEQLFQEFEEAVDAQALSIVDQLDAEIAALGLCLRFGTQVTKIKDVQIWSDGGITFQLLGTTLAQLLDTDREVPLQPMRRLVTAGVPAFI